MRSTWWLFLLFLTAASINRVQSQCSGSALSVSPSLTTYTLVQPTPNDPYSNYVTCEWSISVPGMSQIFVNIEEITLEWNYDFLYIYDGSTASSTQLYYSRYTQTSVKVVMSTSTTMFIRFTSDYSITYSGFKLQVVEADRSVLPACSSQITAIGTQQQISYVRTSFQGSYCEYTIQAASTADRIQYQIPAAQNDQVYVYDGAYAWKSSGSSEYVTTTNTLTIYSDFQYVLNYVNVASSVTANIVSTTEIPEVSMCGVADVVSATSTTKYIVSLYYPYSYGSSSSCWLTINAQSSELGVFLYFEDYAVHHTDYLYIYDGPTSSYNLLGTYWYTGASVNSTGSSLTLWFNSDSSGNLRGYKLRYTEINRATPACAAIFTQYMAGSSPIYIQSMNHPAQYTNSLDEFWLIVKTTETENLVMDITVMNVEESSNCVYDSINIYDGACTSDPVLAVVCGSTPVTFEDSSGIYVLVNFKTDASVTGTGFSMTVYTGSYADDEDDFELADWVIPLIILCVVILILITTVILCCCWYRHQRANKRAKIHASDRATLAPPKLKRKLTTHQLLIKFKDQIADDEKKKKEKKKKYDAPPTPVPPPAPPGPNTIFINRGGMVHPPPQPQPQPPPQPQPQPYPPQGPPQPPPGADPVYPPAQNIYAGGGGPGGMPPPVPVGGQGMPAPVLLQGQGGPQPQWLPREKTDLSLIPSPFTYISPAEARARAGGPA